MLGSRTGSNYWGLDRIDERYLPLDGNINFSGKQNHLGVIQVHCHYHEIAKQRESWGFVLVLIQNMSV